ncbi:hypothetical protein FJ364_00245 [Candidatus Dependentiae bacterium]|nr:hypothetical protein [Candidatus Dependentiae bacterium]
MNKLLFSVVFLTLATLFLSNDCFMSNRNELTGSPTAVDVLNSIEFGQMPQEDQGNNEEDPLNQGFSEDAEICDEGDAFQTRVTNYFVQNFHLAAQNAQLEHFASFMRNFYIVYRTVQEAAAFDPNNSVVAIYLSRLSDHSVAVLDLLMRIQNFPGQNALRNYFYGQNGVNLDSLHHMLHALGLSSDLDQIINDIIELFDAEEENSDALFEESF